VVNAYRAVDVSRDGTVVGPAVRFKANWLEVTAAAGDEVVRSDNKAKTKFGPASAGRGHNGLKVLDVNVDFMLEEDAATGNPNKLDASDSYWYLYNTVSGDDFITFNETSKITDRLKPSSTDYTIDPIQTDDSNPTYHHMSGPPGVGRTAAPPGVEVVESEHGSGARSETLAGIIPERTSLSSPFGNPTRGAAEMLLAVAPENAGVFRVEVFDVAGRRVAVLRNESLTPGMQRIQWTGEASSGGRVAAGTYFVRVEGPGFRSTRKLVLVK